MAITLAQQQQRIQQLINLDNQADKQADAYYDRCLAFIKNHLTQFFQQYALDNNLSLAQTSALVSKWDLRQWKQAIDEMDMSDWPEEATIRAKAYGKFAGIDKGHLITAVAVLGMLQLAVNYQKMIDERVKQDKADELARMKKEFGGKQVTKSRLKLPSVNQPTDKKAVSFVTEKATREQWSSRLWMNTDAMANDVESLVNKHLRQGMSLDDLQHLLAKHINPDQYRPNQSIADRIRQTEYETRRMIRTESARMVDAVNMATYRQQGIEVVNWVCEPGACMKCIGIMDNGPYGLDEAPLIPGDSHPNCRCSKVPYHGTSKKLLPNQDNIVVEVPKIRDYALNLEHNRGKSKARVFKAALGLTRSDYPYLLNQILKGSKESKSTFVGDGYSKGSSKYQVDMVIKGKNGKKKVVRTGWEVKNGQTRLTSVYVRNRKRKRR